MDGYIRGAAWFVVLTYAAPFGVHAQTTGVKYETPTKPGKAVIKVESVGVGDRGCYVRGVLTEDPSKGLDLLADYDCEDKLSAGGTYSVSWKTVDVQASSCEGDPNCTDTDKAPMIVKVEMSTASLTGMYDSKYGTVFLISTGCGVSSEELAAAPRVDGEQPNVAGWYGDGWADGGNPEGVLYGVVKGNLLTFRWEKPASGKYGHGVWKIEGGGSRLAGTWGYGPNKNRSRWDLTRNNTKWKKFQKEEKTAEAKINLTGFYTAQKSFFSEYNTYATDLLSVFWMPDGDPLYMYGLCNEFPAKAALSKTLPSYDPSRSTSVHPAVVKKGEYKTAHTAALGDPCTLLRHLNLEDDFAATGVTFKLFAIGNIDDDPDLDVWSIDHNKKLTHERAD